MFSSIWKDVRERFLYGDTVVQLVLINVIVWVVVILLGLPLKAINGGFGASNPLVDWLAVPSGGIPLLTRPWTVFTYMFLHEDLFHILFNMLFLYFFGQVLVNFLGNKRVIPIYVLGGLMGFLFYFFSANLLETSLFGKIGTPMLGASAGVMAVVMAAATIAPTHTFHLMFIGPVQIRYIAFFFILLDILAIQNADPNTGGSLAHLGGVFLGWLFISQLKKGTDWSVGFNVQLDKFRNLLLTIQDKFKSKPKPASKKRKKGPRMGYKNEEKVKTRQQTRSSSTVEKDIGHQEKIDTILDKIKESGYSSLTKEEKEYLFKASKEK